MSGRIKEPKRLPQTNGVSKATAMKQKHGGSATKTTARKTKTGMHQEAHNINRVNNDLHHLSLSGENSKDPMFSSLGKHSVKQVNTHTSRCFSSCPWRTKSPLQPHIKAITATVQNKVGPGGYEFEYQKVVKEVLLRCRYDVKPEEQDKYITLNGEHQYSDQKMDEMRHRGYLLNDCQTIPDCAIVKTCNIPDIIARMHAGPGPWEIIELKAKPKLECDDFMQTNRYLVATGHNCAYLINFGPVPAEVYMIYAGQQFFSPLFDNGKKTLSVTEPATKKYLNGSCKWKTVNGVMRKVTQLPSGEIFSSADVPSRRPKADYERYMLERKTIKNKHPNSHAATTSHQRTPAQGNGPPRKPGGVTSNLSPGKVSVPKNETRNPNSAQKTHSRPMNSSPHKVSPTKQRIISPTKPTKKLSRPIGLTRRLDI